MAPISDYAEMFFPELHWYNPTYSRTASYNAILFARRWWFVFPVVSLLIAIVSFVAWIVTGRRLALLWFAMLTASFPHLILIWHADAMEHGRHALVPVVIIRIAVFLAACYLIEHFGLKVIKNLNRVTQSNVNRLLGVPAYKRRPSSRYQLRIEATAKVAVS
jgi:hypothetical protein